MTPTGDEGLLADRFWELPAKDMAELGKRADIHQATVGGVRVWVVTGYSEALRALTDPSLRKDAQAVQAVMRAQLPEGDHAAYVASMAAGMDSNMIYLDGVDHVRLRRVVGTEFSRVRVNRLRPGIEEAVAQLLASLPVDEPVDIVNDVASPLMHALFGNLLGLRAQDLALLSAWTRALVEDDAQAMVSASEALKQCLEGLVAACSASPGDDMLSRLMFAPDPADRLSGNEIIGTVFLLLTGFQATVNLITAAVFRLLTEGAWSSVRESPQGLAKAIEEVLRYDTPTRMSTYRLTSDPVVYGGKPIPAGELMLIWLHAVNRDASRSPDADKIDLARSPNTHLAYGHGEHYCFGAQLSRISAMAVVDRMIEFYPVARLTDVAAVRHSPNALMGGLLALPVALGPPQRSTA